MRIITQIDQITIPFKNAVVTIGNFDGVHIGHQNLFRQVIKKAKALGGTSVVVTFEPHPLRVIKSNKHFPLITLYEQKVELIDASGIEVLVCIPFTEKFAATSAREFVDEYLCRRIGMKTLIVGEDYSFGRGREGNVELLRKLGEERGFDLIVSQWSETGGRRVSSTEIRNLVAAGKVEEARELLGRHYQVRGTVVRGRDRGGRLLGFPTANLKLNGELCPKHGVYAVRVAFNGRSYDGVANIGYSPTFNNGIFSVEVHILDFTEDIYGSRICVNFISRLRGEEKFPSPEALAVQIRRDVEEARKILSS